MLYKEDLILFERENVQTIDDRGNFVTGKTWLIQVGKESKIYLQWAPLVSDDISQAPPTMKPISLDIRALREYRRTEHMPSGRVSLLFTYVDGSSPPPLYFATNSDYLDLKETLEQYMTINRSMQQPSVFILGYFDPADLAKSYECLGLYPDSREQRAHEFSFPREEEVVKEQVNRKGRGLSSTLSMAGGLVWPTLSSTVHNVRHMASTVYQQRRNSPSSSSPGSGSPALGRSASPCKMVATVNMSELLRQELQQQQQQLSRSQVPGQPRTSICTGDSLPQTNSVMVTSTDEDLDLEIVSNVEMARKTRLPPVGDTPRIPPLTKELWKRHLTPTGAVQNVDELKRHIFFGGIEASLRPTVWKYLLGYYKWEFSDKANAARKSNMADTYLTMKDQWQSITPEQEQRNTLYKERKSLIEKDVHRTDRTMEYFKEYSAGNLTVLNHILMTYGMYNFDLGYVQGMSDLLAPLLMILNDEVDAFWCFAAFMEQVQDNFQRDQPAIKRQFCELFAILQVLDHELASYLVSTNCQSMLFAFRWLLVRFKREFTMEDVLSLWEVMWSEHVAGGTFHLLVAAAILIQRRDQIMGPPGLGFNELLKFINDEAYQIQLQDTLVLAERFYRQLVLVKSQLPEDVKRPLNLTE